MINADSIKYGGKTDEVRQRAKNIMHKLVIKIGEILTNEDAPESVRAEALYLNGLLMEMATDPNTYTVTVANNYAFVENDGGGLETAINGNPRNRRILIADDERLLNANSWILLAHELGGAYSTARGGPHNRPAVRAENAARALVGCQSRNAAHLFDNIPFSWGNPTCRQ